MILAPSILAANKDDIFNEIKELEDYDIKWLHLDVMDGEFVEAVTFGPDFVKKIRPVTDIFFDVHLMVADPLDVVEDWVHAGADLITFHYEATKNPMEVINKIREYDKQVGVSIKPNTEITEIENLLEYVDLVLVMSVEPGKGGQSFMPEAIDKIKALKDCDCLIQVDGGINDVTGKMCVEAGADILVAGTFVFSDKKNIRKFGQW